MVSDKLEVECPVCDHKVPSDATQCPNCGAEFSFSGVEELQKVAQDINVQEAEAVVTATEEVVDPVPVATSTPESAGEEKRKDSLLGKFFKKKR